MTDIEIEQQEFTEAPERALLRRTFAAELSEGDGRTVDVRIVPYGERVVHNDGLGGARRGIPYTEEFAPGAFSHQLNAANRANVFVNVEHEVGIGGIVGHGKTLVERDDGLYGSLQMHDNADGEKALMLVREGLLDGISLEALPRKYVRTAAGVVRRVKADLINIALTRFSAYKGAMVLAVREEVVLDEELLPIPIDPGLVERNRLLGVELPEQLKAHPAKSDTPASSGTSAGGTRQDGNHHSSLEGSAP